MSKTPKFVVGLTIFLVLYIIVSIFVVYGYTGDEFWDKDLPLGFGQFMIYLLPLNSEDGEFYYDSFIMATGVVALIGILILIGVSYYITKWIFRNSK